MKTIQLFLFCLLLYSQNILAQVRPFNENQFSYENQLGSHIHHHESGYFYVDQEFLNSSNERSNKPELDSSIYVEISMTGDTTIKWTTIYTISEDNRLIKSEVMDNSQSGSGRLTNSIEYFYEMQGDSLIHRETTYYFDEDGLVTSSRNRIFGINTNGLITSFKQQWYNEGLWVNDRLVYWNFNDYGCQVSFNEFSWENASWIPLFKTIALCDEELKQNEYFSNFSNLGTTENIITYKEFLYDEDQKLISITEYFPSWDDPEILEENSLSIYTYNTEGLNDTVAYWLCDYNDKEFYVVNYNILEYDELNNVTTSEYFRFDNFNSLYLSSQAISEFDNNFIKGDFISGGVNSDFNSMLMRYTYNNFNNLLSETKYFYSIKSVNSTERFENLNFEVYPNPTSGDLNINILEVITPNSNIVIRNSTGAIVWSQIADNDNSIHVGHLPSGIYFISLKGNNLRSEIKKFIKL